MRFHRTKCALTVISFVFSCILFVFLTIDNASRILLSSKQSINNTFLVIIITSAGQNVQKRDIIRSTWLKLAPPDSKHLFIVGGISKAYDVHNLENENMKYNDIMFLPDTNDNYESLTFKVMNVFSYLSEFWTFKFVLKCDDDSFVRVANIVSELKIRFDNVNNLYWGFFNGAASVKKKGRWKETKWVLCDRYLPYALGGGYVLSQSLVRFIAVNRHRFVMFQPEDVSVGTWLAPVNVTRIHDPRFDTEYMSRGCSNSYLITHKHDITNMLYFHSTIINTGNLCNAEYKLRLSYLYNWEVEPSKCCIRHNASIP